MNARNRRQATSRLNRSVSESLERSGLATGKHLVVAVSGGPDSLALLYALNGLSAELDLRLHGAHLDHGLRGDQSTADAEFVSGVFNKLSLPFTADRADVAAFRRKHHLSLEEAARELRYAFLARVAKKHHADAIALGHTSDDQAETVLLNLVRGTGTQGLRGIEPIAKRTIDGVEVALVRPLLEVSRADTIAYCDALGLRPREDASNLDTSLTRNRVRLKLLPALEAYNPSVRDALLRLSRSAARDLDFINIEVERAWPDIVSLAGATVTLHTKAFLGLHPAVAAHLLRRAVLEVKGDLQDVEQVHIDDMARLITGPAGRTLDLPGGLMISAGYGEASITPKGGRDQSTGPKLQGEHALIVPGRTRLNGRLVTTSIRDRDLADLPNNCREPAGHIARLDYDAAGACLHVRARRPGDRLQPLGMAEEKKLQDFMVDEKIPRAQRDEVPLVVSERGILWVVGWRIADWAKVTDATARVLELRFEEE